MEDIQDKLQNDKFSREDARYLAKRREVAELIGIENLWEIVDQFALYSGVQTLATRLAGFEIIKQALKVPGHFFEFGCWQGANLMFISKVLQLLEPNSHRHVYGFDSFEGLQTFSKADGADATKLRGSYMGNEDRLRTLIRFFEMDEWVHLVKGDALTTISEFEESNQHVMAAFAYIDFDLYEPCMAALKFLEKRLVPGGVIAFDEAFMNAWPGEGRALREFLENNPGKYTSHTVQFARQPTVYLIRK